jgi:hypothetical protein
MSIPRWTPTTKTTRQEERLLQRLTTKRKLFGLLRQHRDALFDEAFQAELEAMYRDTGAGKVPVPPALFAMAVLLQGYDLQNSDADVERSVIDLRWQLVLDRLGATEPAFSQGALHDFRHRLIRHEMDRRLLERTVELAKRTKAFDWKNLPKTLRIAVDSAPLEGAGRVEDTFNLLGHAARAVVKCVAAELPSCTPVTMTPCTSLGSPSWARRRLGGRRPEGRSSPRAGRSAGGPSALGRNAHAGASPRVPAPTRARDPPAARRPRPRARSERGWSQATAARRGA